MTRKSKRLQFHILSIAIVLGAGMSATIINYYRLNNTFGMLDIKDGLSAKLITVHPLSNGLATFSLVHNDKIFIGNVSGDTSIAVINSNIGEDAIAASDTN